MAIITFYSCEKNSDEIPSPAIPTKIDDVKLNDTLFNDTAFFLFKLKKEIIIKNNIESNTLFVDTCGSKLATFARDTCYFKITVNDTVKIKLDYDFRCTVTCVVVNENGEFVSKFFIPLLLSNCQ